MATTVKEIEEWFDEGFARNDAYMVVLCDTFSWEDYPAYFATKDGAQRHIDNPGSMQKVMEVYDLRVDRAAQVSAGTRAWALRPASRGSSTLALPKER